MSDDFRSAWEEAVTMYRAEKAAHERLRAALEGIDAIAVGKKVGAAKKMQVLAREALAFSDMTKDRKSKL